MAILAHRGPVAVDPAHPEFALLANPSHQAYRTLHIAFFLLPLIAGLDKFLNRLADWTTYLAPALPNALHVSKQTFMYGVGAIEIVAAFIVLFVPMVGAWIVMAWLWLIVVNLFMQGGFSDVALRDLALSLGAIALGRLAWAHWAAKRELVTPPAVEQHE
jgi:hypothetical protein